MREVDYFGKSDVGFCVAGILLRFPVVANVARILNIFLVHLVCPFAETEILTIESIFHVDAKHIIDLLVKCILIFPDDHNECCDLEVSEVI